MADNSPVDQFIAGLSNSVRAAIMAEAIIGIVAGIILLVWPGPTLTVLGVFFGIALILAGIYRLVFAVAGPVAESRSRAILGILGAFVLIAGLITVFDPGSTLAVIAIFVGIAWVFSGVHELVAGLSGRLAEPRWVALLNGIVSIVAGIIAFTLPGLALATFAIVAGILLIIVSIVTLAHLPNRIPTR